MAGVLLAIASAAVFAFGNICTRLGAQRVSPLAGVTVSMVLSTAVAAIPALLLDLPALKELALAGFLWIALLGFINFPVARLLNYIAIGNVGAARADPMFGAAPLFSTILAVIFLDERPGAVVILGTLAVVAGVILIVAPERRTAASAKISKAIIIGYASGLTAAVCYALVTVLSKTILNNYGAPLVVAFLSMAFGTVILAPFGGPSLPASWHTSRRHVLWFALSGILLSFGIVLLLLSLDRTDVIVVGPIISTSPLVTLALVHFFLQRLEKLTIPLVAGAILIVAGAILVVVGNPS